MGIAGSIKKWKVKWKCFLCLTSSPLLIGTPCKYSSRTYRFFSLGWVVFIFRDPAKRPMWCGIVQWSRVISASITVKQKFKSWNSSFIQALFPVSRLRVVAWVHSSAARSCRRVHWVKCQMLLSDSWTQSSRSQHKKADYHEVINGLRSKWSNQKFNLRFLFLCCRVFVWDFLNLSAVHRREELSQVPRVFKALFF